MRPYIFFTLFFCSAFLPGTGAHAAVFSVDFPQEVVFGEEFNVSFSFDSGSSQTALAMNSFFVSASNLSVFDIKIGIDAIVNESKKILSDLYNSVQDKWRSSFFFLNDAFTVADIQQDFRLVVQEEFSGTGEFFVSLRESPSKPATEVLRKATEVLRKSIEVSVPVNLVNINTAATEELETLPGVGSVIAQRIVDYRLANGPFQAPEEIMSVSGIDQVKFDGFKDIIEVGGPYVLVFLRHEDTLLAQTLKELPQEADTVTLIDDQGQERAVSNTSVFGQLALIDEKEESFRLSQVQYFESFNSLFLKCIELVSTQEEACDNWQYVVNGSAPFVGMDNYELEGGEVVWVYFGNPREVVLDKNEVQVSEEFVATAQSYQYQDNTWGPAVGFTIGVTKPNPEDPWNPIEVALEQTGKEGIALFTIEEAGEYSVGIKEDFYFPSVQLLVVELAGGGGGAGTTPTPSPSLPEFNVQSAVEFLAGQQKEDGSFGASLFSDWAAVALGAYDTTHLAAQKVKTYLLSDPNSGELPTDYERRAMALMALGVNPYSGVATNYIGKIEAAFDGVQIGDPNLVNDDVFGLLVLRKAGYGSADEIIQRSTAFVLDEQKNDGSWVGGVDMTAAAVQSLSLVKEIDDVVLALEKAKEYLQGAQEQDGGFGNVDSTSWAMQAAAVLLEDWGGDFLAASQGEDGGVGEQNRVWSTSYAIPAALGKPWGQILVSFGKPEPASVSGGTPSPTVSAPGPSLSVAGVGGEEQGGAVQEQVSEKRGGELAQIREQLNEIKEEALIIQRQVALLVQAEARIEAAVATSVAEQGNKEISRREEVGQEVFAAAAAQAGPRLSFDQKMTLSIAVLVSILAAGAIVMIMVLRKRRNELLS